MGGRFALVWAGATCVYGQFYGFAVNYDGSELQFTSSYVLKTDKEPASVPRIYRYQTGQPEELTRTGGTSFTLPTGAYLSDDGETRGLFSYVPCTGSCMIFYPRNGVVLERKGKTFTTNGQDLRVSRNGRWVFDSGFPNFGSRLVDADSGAVRTI